MVCVCVVCVCAWVVLLATVFFFYIMFNKRSITNICCGEESYGKHTGRDGPLPRNSKYLPNDDDVGAKSTELDLEIATVGAPSSARTTSN